MVSHEKIKEILKNWKLENEKLTDVVYDAMGNVSESVCYTSGRRRHCDPSPARGVTKLKRLGRTDLRDVHHDPTHCGSPT